MGLEGVEAFLSSIVDSVGMKKLRARIRSETARPAAIVSSAKLSRVSV